MTMIGRYQVSVDPHVVRAALPLLLCFDCAIDLQRHLLRREHVLKSLHRRRACVARTHTFVLDGALLRLRAMLLGLSTDLYPSSMDFLCSSADTERTPESRSARRPPLTRL